MTGRGSRAEDRLPGWGRASRGPPCWQGPECREHSDQSGIQAGPQQLKDQSLTGGLLESDTHTRYSDFLTTNQFRFQKSPKKESEVAQLCPTLCNPMDCSLPTFSVHEIFQARVPEWVAISFPRGSPQPRDRTWVSCIVGRRFTLWATREVSKKSAGAPGKRGTQLAHISFSAPLFWVSMILIATSQVLLKV